MLGIGRGTAGENPRVYNFQFSIYKFMGNEAEQRRLVSRLRRVAGQMSGLEVLLAKGDTAMIASQFEAAIGALKSAYVGYLQTILDKETLDESDRNELKRILRKLL